MLFYGFISLQPRHYYSEILWHPYNLIFCHFTILPTPMNTFPIPLKPNVCDICLLHPPSIHSSKGGGFLLYGNPHTQNNSGVWLVLVCWPSLLHPHSQSSSSQMCLIINRIFFPFDWGKDSPLISTVCVSLSSTSIFHFSILKYVCTFCYFFREFFFIWQTGHYFNFR